VAARVCDGGEGRLRRLAPAMEERGWLRRPAASTEGGGGGGDGCDGGEGASAAASGAIEERAAAGAGVRGKYYEGFDDFFSGL
jgi:hypothetical protein